VTGIVLAGGRSSRFGADKLAFELDGRPLLHHAIAAVAVVADEVVVVIAADGASPPLPTGLGVPVRIARDAASGLGPLAGVAAGLAAARAPLALLVGGDQPWLRVGILRLLIEELESLPGRPGVDAVALMDGASLWPLPTALRVAAARPAAEVALGGTGRRLSGGRLSGGRLSGRRLSGRRLSGLFGGLRVRRVPEKRWREFDPAGDSLRDVDTPADLSPS
jgi:molybdopterin-guanine dinucleotide biosynthesis protein A